MSEITTKILGDIITLQRGFDITKKEQFLGNYPVVSSSGIKSYHNEYKVKGPGVVIGRKGTLGTVFFVEGNYWPHDTSLWIKDFKGNDPKFIYYFLQGFSLEKLDVGSANPTLNRNYVHLIEASVPSIDLQKKIASVLSSLDAKIELNNRINAELEAMAKLLYDYWFVQFDFPDSDGKPYKSSGGKMVYNEVLKREIPEGWGVKPLAELTDVLFRGISPKYIDEGGICVVNQKCIRDKSINFELSRRHNHGLKSAASKLIEYADILVNSTGVGTLGRVAMVKRLPEQKITVDSHVTIVRADKDKINKIFLGYSLTERQIEIENFARGSTGQTELSRVDLGSLTMLMPPDDLQVSFEKFFSPQIQKMANNENENEHLTELRDWLLPMLMNGQVRVGE